MLLRGGRGGASRNEGLIGIGSALENRFQLEGPGGGGIEFPVRVGGDGRVSVGIIGRVIRAEAEAGPGSGFRGERGEKLGLDDAVFVVTPFRPRIGKEDENVGQFGGGWERIEELAGLGFEEEEVGQFRAVAFAAGAGDAVFKEIDADAERLRVRSRVRREVVAVAAADLEREFGARFRAQRVGQKSFQAGETRVAAGEVVGGAGGIFHRAEVAEAHAVAEVQSERRGVLFSLGALRGVAGTQNG